jgi:hypothetical protein
MHLSFNHMDKCPEVLKAELGGIVPGVQGFYILFQSEKYDQL